MRQILQYLKRHHVTDTQTINRLFVSAFIINNRLEVSDQRFLHKYLITEGERCAMHLSWIQKRLCETNIKLGLEELIGLFEFVISPGDRIVTGAVYTPKDVRRTILKRTLEDKNEEELRNIRIADISCGCGGFLMDAAQWLHHKTGKKYSEIFRENIYGIDIQEYAIERTTLLLSLLALSEGEDEVFKFNLLCRDTLDYVCEDWDARYTRFDIVVGNPPYVCSRNLSEEIHAKLKNYDVCATGHPDLYIPFFQIATEMLNDGGRLGYITMNSFLRSINGRAVRRYFSRNRLAISIVDFRGYQVFDSKNTYTCLFFLKKGIRRYYVQYSVNETGNLYGKDEYIRVPYENLDDLKGWALNDFDNTRQLERTGVAIGDYCGMRHGIATLCNNIYIFRPEEVRNGIYVVTKKGVTYEIEEEICRDVVNSNRLNSEVEFEDIIEKVIFPYRRNADGAIKIIDEATFQEDYPNAYAYLLDNQDRLEKRDKGKTDRYPTWYAFGRTQSLTMPEFKLFFPKFSNKPVRCVLVDDEDLLLYNGVAFVSDDERRLQVLKRIIESHLFWSYIQKNGKPYASGYYSLTGMDVKNYGIPEFNEDEEDALIAMEDKDEIEEFLKRYYR